MCLGGMGRESARVPWEQWAGKVASVSLLILKRKKKKKPKHGALLLSGPPTRFLSSLAASAPAAGGTDTVVVAVSFPTLRTGTRPRGHHTASSISAAPRRTAGLPGSGGKWQADGTLLFFSTVKRSRTLQGFLLLAKLRILLLLFSKESRKVLHWRASFSA